MRLTDHIEINPKVMLGKPVVRGTRVTAELVLRNLADGATEQSLIEAHPQLTRTGILAALAYGAEAISLEHFES